MVFLIIGFPDSSVGKESAFNSGDPGSIPGLEMSDEERIGYSLQYSILLKGYMVKKKKRYQHEICILPLFVMFIFDRVLVYLLAKPNKEI